MLTVVTFKWHTPGYRSPYTAEHVNTMQRMVARHYPHPHRFVCVTDDPEGVNCETYPLWNDHADVANPTWPDGPSCYRRLRVFDMDCFGDRFVCIDLDCVIVGDLTPLWHRPEECVTYASPGLRGGLNGAMFLQSARSRSFVWTLFDPATSPQETARLGHKGSDQAWLTACLQHCSGKWTGPADGIYEYKALRRPQARQVTRGRRVDLARAAVLPDDARIVFFHGKPDPWECNEPWILEHYR